MKKRRQGSKEKAKVHQTMGGGGQQKIFKTHPSVEGVLKGVLGPSGKQSNKEHSDHAVSGGKHKKKRGATQKGKRDPHQDKQGQKSSSKFSKKNKPQVVVIANISRKNQSLKPWGIKDSKSGSIVATGTQLLSGKKQKGLIVSEARKVKRSVEDASFKDGRVNLIVFLFKNFDFFLKF